MKGPGKISALCFTDNFFFTSRNQHFPLFFLTSISYPSEFNVCPKGTCVLNAKVTIIIKTNLAY